MRTHHRFPWTMLLVVLAAAVADGAESPPPITGLDVDAMACVDKTVAGFMEKWQLPGGAVAISKNGRLVYARGFGWADVEKKQPVKPDDRFRIASISKPITAVMILKLSESGKLRLDDSVLRYLDDLKPLPEDAPVDPRFAKITLRDCLRHCAGFDRDASFDPMFMPKPLMKLTPSPVEARTIVRFMLGRPLDFSPGEKYVYSNFGYCMLGRVIERVTGKTYDEAVRGAILEPIGARRTRLGKTRLSDRAEDEVRYYMSKGSKPCRSVFPDVTRPVEEPYGGFYLEALDAHGGWISSTADLLRFVACLEGTRSPRILRSKNVRRMIVDRIPTNAKKSQYYGYGWMMVPIQSDGDVPDADQANWFHSGSLPGTATMLVRTHRGIAWAALFNARPDAADFFLDMDRTLWKAVEPVSDWPEHDLFVDRFVKEPDASCDSPSR